MCVRECVYVCTCKCVHERTLSHCLAEPFPFSWFVHFYCCVHNLAAAALPGPRSPTLRRQRTRSRSCCGSACTRRRRCRSLCPPTWPSTTCSTTDVSGQAWSDHRLSFCSLPVCLNPFTAPACKISRLKDARTRLQTVYFPVL